jgi:Putative rhamnosyl transferase
MSHFQHFLITRMNVDWDVLKLRSPQERNSFEFLNHRFNIFEKTCYPAVNAQTNPNFIWLLLFDVGLPEEFRERLAKCASSLEIIPVYINSKETFLMTLKGAIDEHLLPSTDHLITTNIDSDDVLSRNFVAATQQQFRGQDFEFINFPFGYLYRFQEQRLYLREWLTSSCHTLIEQRQNFQTALTYPHHEVLSNKTRQVITNPMWLMTVHGKNLRTQFDVSAAWQPIARLGNDFCSDIDFPKQSWIETIQEMTTEVLNVISSRRDWDNSQVKARKITNILFPQFIRGMRKLRYR